MKKFPGSYDVRDIALVDTTPKGLARPATTTTFLYGKAHYYVQGVKYARYYDAKVASLLGLEGTTRSFTTLIKREARHLADKWFPLHCHHFATHATDFRNKRKKV